MTAEGVKKAATGYDKYINWKLFIIPLGLLIVLAVIPTPKSMLDVGVEYSLGDKYVKEFFAKELFGKSAADLSQWQVQMVRMMDASVQLAAFTQKGFLKRNEKWCKSQDIPTTTKHLEQVKEFAKSIPPDKFQELLKRGYNLKVDQLNYDQLSDKEKKIAAKAGYHVQIAVGIVLFVVFCFLTEALPLPMVAFSIGIIAMIFGIVNRHNVAEIYWSDATWFIMGSLMFAVAFVKTGVDKRITMMMFGKLKNPNIKWISLIYHRGDRAAHHVYVRSRPGGHVPSYRHPDVFDRGNA